jgi:hypothetical protein
MIVNDKIEKIDVIVAKNKLTCLDKKDKIIKENIMAKQNEMLVGRDLMERKVVDSRLMENFGELFEYIMNSKIEVKFGQLLLSIERNDGEIIKKKMEKKPSH